MSTAEHDVLQQRARELAQPVEGIVLESGTHLVFPAGEERFAIGVSHAVGVVPVGSGLARLPGAPPFLAGVLGVRGRLVTVTDLLPLLGRPAQGVTGASHVIVVEAEGPEVLVPRTALLCSARPEEATIRTEELGPPPETVPEAVRRLVAGVTPELVTVLDVERLLADPLLLAVSGGPRAG
ncbi:MAG TPA: chemotaxis protein CheW [Acidobacteria bacterium]|nr:chemotaxis protein CheW [Acidobacteriota bacterium]